MKRRTPVIVILLSVALAAAAALYLAGLRLSASRPGISVVSSGPLDIRLWGIRPDAAGMIYDPNGKEIQPTLGIARWDRAWWPDDEQRFDFIFELPDVNGVLFAPVTGIRVSGEDRYVGGRQGLRCFEYKGRRLLRLAATFDRSYRMSRLLGLWKSEEPIDAIDLTIRYYLGPGKAAFTITGPFEPNTTVEGPDGSYSVAFAPEAGSGAMGCAAFELTTSTHVRFDTPVVAYDTAGKRHLVDSGGGRTGPGGSRIEYRIPSAGLSEIASIAFDERPCEITFKNIRLDVPKRPSRNYVDYLDEMSRRLALELTAKKMADYQFKSADEALKVVDIIRGTHIWHTGQVLLHGGLSECRLDPQGLTAQQAEKLKQTALRWTNAMEPEIRAIGIQIGLLCKWPEFVEPAFEMLDYRSPCDSSVSRGERSEAANALLLYNDSLSEHDIQRITEHLLGPSSRDTLILKRCLVSSVKSEVRIAALWQLAEDDRPWLWWDAVSRLADWRDFEGRQDSLDEKMKVRLFLVKGPKGFSNPEQIAPRAYELLGGLLSPELLRLDEPTFSILLFRLADSPDRRQATAAMVDFLRRAEDYTYPKGIWSIDKIVRYINFWCGLDIGNLGADILKRTRDMHNWREIAAEAVKWFDENKDFQLVGSPFSGRVVDTKGDPIEGATVTLTGPGFYTDEQGNRRARSIALGAQTTDAEGRFAIADVKQAELLRPDHHLDVTADGFAPRTELYVQRLPGGVYKLTDNAGPANDNTVELQRPATITGTALAADGTPMVDVGLRLFSGNPYGGNHTQTLKTDSAGGFSADNVTSGCYVLSYHRLWPISAGRTWPQRYGGVCAARLIEVSEGRNLNDVTLDLSQSTSSLEVTVIDAAGAPVDAATIVFDIAIPSGQYAFGQIFNVYHTATNGVFRFDNLPPVEGAITARSADHNHSSDRLKIKLTPKGTLHCTVKYTR